MLDAVSDLRAALESYTPEKLVKLEAFDLAVKYDHSSRSVEISVTLIPELALLAEQAVATTTDRPQGPVRVVRS